MAKLGGANREKIRQARGWRLEGLLELEPRQLLAVLFPGNIVVATSVGEKNPSSLIEINSTTGATQKLTQPDGNTTSYTKLYAMPDGSVIVGDQESPGMVDNHRIDAATGMLSALPASVSAALDTPEYAGTGDGLAVVVLGATQTTATANPPDLTALTTTVQQQGQAIATLTADVAALKADSPTVSTGNDNSAALANIQQRLDDQDHQIADLGQKLVEAATDAGSDASKIDAIAQEVQQQGQALDDLKKQFEAFDPNATDSNTGDAATLASLAARVASLEQQAGGPGSSETPTDLPQALANLQQEVERQGQQIAQLTQGTIDTARNSVAIATIQQQQSDEQGQITALAPKDIASGSLDPAVTDQLNTMQARLDERINTLSDSLNLTDQKLDNLDRAVANQATQQRTTAAQKAPFNNASDAFGVGGIALGAAAAVVGIGATVATGGAAAFLIGAAAGSSLVSAGFNRLSRDPADANYQVIPQPSPPAPLTVTSRDGVTTNEANAFTNLQALQVLIIGVDRAIASGIDKAQGAANAGDLAWEDAQVTAATGYMKQLGTLTAQMPSALVALNSALTEAGVVVSVSPTQAAALATSLGSTGLNSALLQDLTTLGASPDELTEVQQSLSAQATRLAMASTSETLSMAFGAIDTAIPAAVDALDQGMVTPLTGSAVTASAPASYLTPVTTSNAHPTFRGTAPAGFTIQVLGQRTDQASPVVLGQAVAGPDGSWSVASSALDDGSYAIEAQATSAADGTTMKRILDPVVVDTTGPHVTAETYDPKAGVVSVTLRDDFSGLDPASVQGIVRRTTASRPRHRSGMTASGVSAASLAGSSEAVVVTIKAKAFGAAARRSLQAALDRVTDLAGNRLDDPNLRVITSPTHVAKPTLRGVKTRHASRA